MRQVPPGTAIGEGGRGRGYRLLSQTYLIAFARATHLYTSLAAIAPCTVRATGREGACEMYTLARSGP